VTPSVILDKVMLRVMLSDAHDGTVRVYDSAGRLIKQLLKISGSGFWQFLWDGKDNEQKKVPAGVYYIHLEVEGESVSEKIVVVK
jgi:flagellar hook assembly protein FlgD